MIARKAMKPWGYDLIYAETEKYVGKLCQYLAAIKGYKYWPNVKKRGE